ncbi:MAG: diguanylate cyclase [Congregibacter sp.]
MPASFMLHRPVRRALKTIVPLLFTCCLLSALPVSALNPDRLPSQYLFEHFGRDRGLPSDTVWTTREGPRGYLWIGTQGGLARFDGERFSIFNEHTHSAFKANDIRDLEWTPSGELWIATYGGGAVVMRANSFEHFGVGEGLAGAIVYDIHRASDGSLWFATNNGISRLRNGRIRSWTTSDGLADNRVIKIAEATNGDLWFSGVTDGLSHFNGVTFKPVGLAAGLDSLKIHLLKSDPELGVITSTAGGTAYQAKVPGQLTPLPWSTEFSIEDVLVDKDGNRWLGSYGNGLWRLLDNGEIEAFSFGDDTENAHIFSMIEDTSGNLWVSSSRGLYRIHDSEFLSIGKYEGLSDATFVVTGNRNGTLWAGTEAYGLFRVDPNGSVSQPYAELRDKDISSLLVRGNGELWVGTFGDGIYRVNGSSITRLTNADGLVSEHIFALKETLDGSVWIGTTHGVNRWQNDAPQKLTSMDALDATTARHISEGQNGRVWISTSNGLYEYSPDGVRRWGIEQGLPNEIVIGTYEDDRGVLWIVMRDGGIARLDGDQLFSFGEVRELQRLSAFSITQDRSRNLWIAGATGLMRVSRDDLDGLALGKEVRLRHRLYSEVDGLRSSQFVGGFQPVVWAGPDNRLWFSTARGLTGFDPRELAYEQPVPSSFIEAVRVNGKTVAVTEPLVLPSVVRSLEIDYSAPALSNAPAVKFRYSLGDGGIWEEVGGRRTAYFSSLPAGEWVFHVQAKIGDDAYAAPGADTAQLTLQRNPRWYETTWSVLAGCIGLTVVLTLIQRLLSRRAREREQELRGLVDTRTEELSRALRQVQANARIDSLTGIANRRHMDERLAGVWNMAHRSGVPVSILMIDIDRFKQYNDALGHNEGDECLKLIASAINDNIVREHDMVARYGGEEFLVMLYDSDKEGTATAAQRLIDCIRQLELPHPDSDVGSTVTVSVGLATGGPKENSDVYTLVKLADIALYEAKHSGRNSIASA